MVVPILDKAIIHGSNLCFVVSPKIRLLYNSIDFARFSMHMLNYFLENTSLKNNFPLNEVLESVITAAVLISWSTL